MLAACHREWAAGGRVGQLPVRHAARVDSNHREVVDTLRSCGWLVKETHQYPGFVDCVAQRGGVVRLVEIKRPKGRLKPSQAKLIADGFDVRVVRTAQEAVELS